MVRIPTRKILIFNTCTVHLLLFCTMTKKCTQLFHKLSHCYMFRHYRVILRQPVINTLPSYTSISKAAVGNTIYHFVLWPTNAQLFHKLSHCYMFRPYRVILRQLVINTLPSYTSTWNAAVGNTNYHFVLWPTNAQLFHKLSHCYMFRHCGVILRQLVILYYDQQTHNYFTIYHTATCFGTIVSSSDSL